MTGKHWWYKPFELQVDYDGIEVVPGLFLHQHVWDSDVEFDPHKKYAALGCRCGESRFFDNPEAGAEG